MSLCCVTLPDVNIPACPIANVGTESALDDGMVGQKSSPVIIQIKMRLFSEILKIGFDYSQS